MQNLNRNSNRRDFLSSAGLAVGAVMFMRPSSAASLSSMKPVQLGLISDVHIGLAEDAEKRMMTFLDAMSQQSPDGLLQLGDFAYPETRFKHIFDVFNKASKNPIHVIGNHDYDYSHTAEDCIQVWGIPARYYSRQLSFLRLIVLDGNEKGSPTHHQHGGYPSYIGPEQQEWLEAELSACESPVLILSHQPLAGQSAIDNASQMQTLLSRFRDKIVLCLNGHSHVDQLVEVEGVRYLHVNSASYYWLGGKAKWAKYAEPLYAMIEFDPQSNEIKLRGTASSWLGQSPDEVGYFNGKDESLKEIVVPQIRDRRFDAALRAG